MLNVVRFNDQLRRMGQDMSWARAAMCPCRDPHSGGASASCPVCKARGVLWSDPVGCRAGLSGMKVQREWANFGQWESGDVVVSVGSDTPLYAAGENDRVVFTQSSEAFDLVLTRGAVAERLRFAVISWDRCFWLDGTGSAIIEGDLPDGQQDDGSPLWTGDLLSPPAGRPYTLRGRRRPSYFMFRDFAQDRAHYGGLALPRRLALRKFSLFGL